MTNAIWNRCGAPRVSIVMPAYRTAGYIGDAIASVLGQTYSDFELIIVDDCSSDDTIARAQEAAAGDPRIRIIALTRNGGAGPARNRAIGEARGRFIAFLDSDDLWYPDKLAVQVTYMEKHACALTYGPYDYIDEQSRKTASLPAPARMTHAQLLRCCPIGCLTVMYDREVVGTVLMPPLRKRQDWATWLSILAKGGEAHGLDVPLGAYRHRNGSLSHTKWKLLAPNWTMYRTEVGLGPLSAGFHLMVHSLNYVLRRYVPGFAQRVGFL